jgi:hypothetical protein
MFSTTLAKSKQDLELIWQRRSTMLVHIQADEWPSIVGGAKAAQDKAAKE